jgi:hypothetical protein
VQVRELVAGEREEELGGFPDRGDRDEHGERAKRLIRARSAGSLGLRRLHREELYGRVLAYLHSR